MWLSGMPPNGRTISMGKKRKRHSPEEIVEKLRDAEAMQNSYFRTSK